MTDKALENLKKCKMDCFHCPFPDCVLPYRIPDKAREMIVDKEKGDIRE